MESLDKKSEETISKEVIGILRSMRPDFSKEITEKSDFISDLGMGPFDLTELSCYVEEEYHLPIPEKEVWRLNSVSDYVNFIKKQKDYLKQ